MVVKKTLEDARQVDKSITTNDVNEFLINIKKEKTNLRGYNSYIADAAYEEFQVDSFFINDWDEFEKQKFLRQMLLKHLELCPFFR